MSGRYSRALNVVLRMTTLGIRFLLIFYLARFLDTQSVGYYGLFTATLGFVMYFVGLDFYIYATRELLKLPSDMRGAPIKAQAILSLCLYVLVLPLAVLVIRHLGWPGNLIWWFLIIIILEHVNQEIFRLLIALSQQVTAGFLMFIRQGSWAVATVILMAAYPETRKLDTVMILWAGSGIITAIAGGICLRGQKLGGWKKPVDWNWLRKGIKVSGFFLLATLALRAVQTLDRYFQQSFAGIDSVAAYVLFLGMAAALLTFLDAGVFAFGYPDLIARYQRGDASRFRLRLRQMMWQTLGACIIFGVASWLILPLLLEWINNPAYGEAAFLYPWLLLAMILNALAMVPHYALYATGQDRPIILSHLTALPVFLLSAWFLGQMIPTLAVPVALAISFGLILLWKTLSYWRRGFDSGTNDPLSDEP